MFDASTGFDGDPGPPWMSHPPKALLPLAIVMFGAGLLAVHWGTKAHVRGTEPWLSVLLLFAAGGALGATAIRLAVRAYGRRSWLAGGMLGTAALYLASAGGLAAVLADAWVLGIVEIISAVACAVFSARWVTGTRRTRDRLRRRPRATSARSDA